jgi:hypothetical protein
VLIGDEDVTNFVNICFTYCPHSFEDLEQVSHQLAESKASGLLRFEFVNREDIKEILCHPLSRLEGELLLILALKKLQEKLIKLQYEEQRNHGSTFYVHADKDSFPILDLNNFPDICKSVEYVYKGFYTYLMQPCIYAFLCQWKPRCICDACKKASTSGRKD